jgi:regulator of RNase E activity RraB
MDRFRRLKQSMTPSELKQKMRPSEVEKPVDPDERSPQLGIKFKDLEVMGALIEANADLSQSREVTYYLYAPDREIGQRVADAARTRGFTTTVREPLPDHPDRWAIICGKDAAVTPDFVRDTTDYFEALAAETGVTYDGWEASVEGKKGQGPRTGGVFE